MTGTPKVTGTSPVPQRRHTWCENKKNTSLAVSHLGLANRFLLAATSAARQAMRASAVAAAQEECMGMGGPAWRGGAGGSGVGHTCRVERWWRCVSCGWGGPPSTWTAGLRGGWTPVPGSAGAWLGRGRAGGCSTGGAAAGGGGGGRGRHGRPAQHQVDAHSRDSKAELRQATPCNASPLVLSSPRASRQLCRAGCPRVRLHGPGTRDPGPGPGARGHP